MDDSAIYLSFKTRRSLTFQTSRPLDFDFRRELAFSTNRPLNFDFRRGVPFGKRGVTFRGYVCPVCSVAVLPDAKSCDQCGTLFVIEDAARVPPPRSPNVVKSAQKARYFACVRCNASLPVGARQCGKCGTLFSSSAPPPPPPPAMGVVFCPGCDLKVASDSDYCPQCGSPISAHARGNAWKHAQPPVSYRGEGVGYRTIGTPEKKKEPPLKIVEEERDYWSKR
ncbi:MAG: zinc ribbon domain-containing protein [Euryarchaeota archaeon]|nr:zinc ribbon domain-containing protein [Euryarchaeota archaeon]